VSQGGIGDRSPIFIRWVGALEGPAPDTSRASPVGVTHSAGAVALNLVAALLLIVPTTVVLTMLESSPREASVGKLTRHLHVVDAVTGTRVSFRRWILRNTLKIGVPWTIGNANQASRATDLASRRASKDFRPYHRPRRAI